MDSGAISALTFGFLLGLKHATDADHVVAVSTIVSEYRSAWKGIWVGGSWGLGHTTPLLILGGIILTFQEVILEHYKFVTPLLEFGVGLMLVFLGIQVFWNLSRGKLHLHEHSHDQGPHLHIHSTHNPSEEPHVYTPHGFIHLGRPLFRMKSFLIGFVHGLAGSAAVMLLLIPTITSTWVAIGYLILFSVGTILSMAVITLFLGIPFVLTSRSNVANRIISGAASTASLLLGCSIISDQILGTTITPF